MIESDKILIKEYNNYCIEKGIKIRSVGIAQAMIESSHGKSDLYINNNNCFGIKYTNRADYKVTYKTSEYVNGQYISIDADFSGFNSLKNCFDDYCHIVNPVEIKSVEEYLQRLTEIGYATSPSYIQLIKDVIKDFELEKYDSKDVSSLDYFITTYEDYQKQLNRIVNEVIEGKFGNGEERKIKLGSYYNIIQEEVNRRYE